MCEKFLRGNLAKIRRNDFSNTLTCCPVRANATHKTYAKIRNRTRNRGSREAHAGTAAGHLSKVSRCPQEARTTNPIARKLCDRRQGLLRVYCPRFGDSARTREAG